MTEPESPWQGSEKLHADIESASDFWDDQISNHSVDRIETPNSLSIWNNVHDSPPVIDAHTWETLGILESKKEPPFLSESNAAILHIAKLKQAGVLSLLSEQVLISIPLITEVPFIDFLRDVKLLLLGIESKSFSYDATVMYLNQRE